jgi:copper resistance protein C
MSTGGRRLGAALVAALTLVVVGAAPAAAHNRIVGSDPADGATLARTPSAVVLTFNEPAIAMGTRIAVTGPDGPVGVGTPQLVDSTVTQPLAGGAPAGRYTVDWRVTSADGHPITGVLAFTTQAPGESQPDPAPAPAAEPAAEPTPAAWPWLLLAGALFTLAGALMVRRRLQERRDAAPRDDPEGPRVSGPAG